MNQRRDHYRVTNSQTLCEHYLLLLRRVRPGATARRIHGARRGTETLDSVSGILSEWHKQNKIKTFNNGSLGSGIDEERSEMR